MATRKERRIAIANNIPAPISYKLVEKMVEEGNETAVLLQAMLNEEIYATRLKIKAYELKFITSRDFLMMTDVYMLPLGLDGKEFMLANYVADELDRFNLSTTIAKKGDLLTAYFIDRYDSLYEVIVDSTKSDFTKDTAYQDEFVAMLLDANAEYSFSMISEFLEEHKDVKKLLK